MCPAMGPVHSQESILSLGVVWYCVVVQGYYPRMSLSLIGLD